MFRCALFIPSADCRGRRFRFDSRIAHSFDPFAIQQHQIMGHCLKQLSWRACRSVAGHWQPVETVRVMASNNPNVRYSILTYWTRKTVNEGRPNLAKLTSSLSPRVGL
jgi:hypothetical protein